MSVETLEPIDLDLADMPIDIFELANAGATIESITDQGFMLGTETCLSCVTRSCCTCGSCAACTDRGGMNCVN